MEKTEPSLKPKFPYKLSNQHMTMGTDAEFFFLRDGKVVGSETLIPENGLISEDERKRFDLIGVAPDKPHKSCKRDGIQAELESYTSSCRANLGFYIGRDFSEIKRTILDADPSLSISFDPLVEIGEKEFDPLSDTSKELGCSPSWNVYTGMINEPQNTEFPIRTRVAAGHIHISTPTGKENPERLVPMLDVIVGNTCVLMDRNPDNVIRRKIYGKAGEYRTPSYGIEYRTLSNFWLKDYKVMSLVFNLVRTATNLVQSDISNNGTVFEDAIKSVINFPNIRKAINQNNYDLALSNFLALEPVLLDIIDTHHSYNRIFTRNTIKYFHHFYSHPLDHWFKGNPLDSWCAIHDGHGLGWENYRDSTVKESYHKAHPEDTVVADNEHLD